MAAAWWWVGCAAAFPEQAYVRRVIDGDTVELEDGRLVRYIGIDAPESRRKARPGDREWRAGVQDRWVEDPQPLSREATQMNRRLVEGKMIRLEYDAQPLDRFGRLLAYVYDGDVMINAQLLRAGLARLLTIPPNVKYVDRFRAQAEEARRQRRGLWAD